jgi:hypothetical protein
VSAYSLPDTSDKKPDENWLQYWDRKRHERHGDNCGCLLCDNEPLLKSMGQSLLPKDLKLPEEWFE